VAGTDGDAESDLGANVQPDADPHSDSDDSASIDTDADVNVNTEPDPNSGADSDDMLRRCGVAIERSAVGDQQRGAWHDLLLCIWHL
jgi:hypothetical protein